MANHTSFVVSGLAQLQRKHPPELTYGHRSSWQMWGISGARERLQRTACWNGDHQAFLAAVAQEHEILIEAVESGSQILLQTELEKHVRSQPQSLLQTKVDRPADGRRTEPS